MASAAPFTAPKLSLRAFHCPHCGTYAAQIWYDTFGYPVGAAPTPRQVPKWKFAVCTACGDVSFWRDDTMYYPLGGAAPLPNPDLSGDLKRDFDEAREIVGRSPRGAAALLRLLIQKMCVKLGEDGENLNNAIKGLVKKGLPETVQQALDSVRVIGNNAVHPGQIDLKDDVKTAGTLFELVNFIAEKVISDPKKVAAIYGTLPKSTTEAIEKRDGKK